MLGTFQKSHIRLEIEASQGNIGDCLLRPLKLSQWLFPGILSPGLPERLHSGINFTSYLGFVTVNHQVKVANDQCLRLLLSSGIDGYHEWYWGDGWVQSRLEGVSLLPLNLGQTYSLLRLRQYLGTQGVESNKPPVF